MATLPEITEIEIDGQVYQIADAQAREAIKNATQAIPTIPSQLGTLTYNGSAQTPTFSNYNEAQLTMVVEAKTAAGTYTATFTPKEGYKWFDDTTEAKTVSWTILKKSYAVPSIPNNSKSYTGSAQSPAITGFDSNAMTKSGDSGTNVNSYAVKFNLKDTANTQWNDATTGEKTVAWYIVRAAGSLSLDKTTMMLDVSNLTGTITPNRHGSNGAISASSSNTGIATVSVNSSTGVITVTGKAKGNVTISVTMAQGTNHNAVTTAVTCAVTVKIPSTNLSDNDWSDLGSIGAAGNGASYFSVGDCMPTTVNGTVGTKSFNTTLYAFIIGFNHNGVNGIYFQCFKNAKTNGKQVALCDFTGQNWYSKTDGTKAFNMNHWGNYNYGGWKGCDLRYDILGSTDKAPSGYGSQVQTNRVGYDATSAALTSPKSGTLMAALPASLRAVMKPMTVYTDNKGNSSNVSGNVTTSVDYLPLLSEFEVHGARSYANQYEQNNQKQFDYYKNGNSKIFYNHNDGSSAVYWWCRSPSYDDATGFCLVSVSGGASAGNAHASFGLAPAFRVA